MCVIRLRHGPCHWCSHNIVFATTLWLQGHLTNQPGYSRYATTDTATLWLHVPIIPFHQQTPSPSVIQSRSSSSTPIPNLDSRCTYVWVQVPVLIPVFCAKIRHPTKTNPVGECSTNYQHSCDHHSYLPAKLRFQICDHFPNSPCT